MRKTIVGQDVQGTLPTGGDWLDVALLARAEMTSEDPAHPIEAALQLDAAVCAGWRAAEPGEQTVRFLFDRPITVRQVLLVFTEGERARTQEFVLRWSADGASFHEVVRQQYTFAPPHTGREVEEYAVELSGVAVLELKITPDIAGGDARAALSLLRVAGAVQ